MTYCPLTNKLSPSRTFIAEKLEEPFTSVLELGCQWGENLLAIQGKFPDKRLVGIDTDKDKLEIAGNLTKGIEFIADDVLKRNFNRDEFDITFTNALFCMLRPVDAEYLLRQIIKTTKHRILLMELKCSGIGYAKGGRTCADFTGLFAKYGLEAKEEKLGNLFNCEPWNTYGYFWDIKL